jgi:hypothetical protein
MIEKIWYLPAPYSEDDCVWINSSGLLYEVLSPDKWGDTDSGWCDYATGQEVLTNLHEVYLRTTDEKGEMWLKLKYIDRVKLQRVMNHNMSEVLRRKQNDTID